MNHDLAQSHEGLLQSSVPYEGAAEPGRSPHFILSDVEKRGIWRRVLVRIRFALQSRPASLQRHNLDWAREVRYEFKRIEARRIL